MTVTCDTVRRAFGEFQCCKHEHDTDDLWDSTEYIVCEVAYRLLERNGVDILVTPTHPALLRAIEEQDEN